MKTRNTNVHIFLGQSTLRYILMYGENAILNHMKRIFGGGRVKTIQYREGGLFSNIFA